MLSRRNFLEKEMYSKNLCTKRKPQFMLINLSSDFSRPKIKNPNSYIIVY